MANLEENDMLNYLNYANMIDGTVELLTSDKWDWEILEPPAAVYFPGMDFIKRRVKSITGVGTSDNFQHNSIAGDQTIRGFALPAQPGQITLKNVNVQVTLADFEDQTVYVWLTDWSFKCCDPYTQKSYRARDLRSRNKYYRLNSLNQPVRSWVQEHCIIDGYQTEDQMSGEKIPLGEDSQITFKGILMPPKFENLTAI